MRELVEAIRVLLGRESPAIHPSGWPSTVAGTGRAGDRSGRTAALRFENSDGSVDGMERALWYLFVGTRGGATRAELVRALQERPRNANQLSETLDVTYNTVRYHLEELEDHNVVERGQEGYGALYFLTEQFQHHSDRFDELVREEL